MFHFTLKDKTKFHRTCFVSLYFATSSIEVHPSPNPLKFVFVVPFHFPIIFRSQTFIIHSILVC